ncbi:CD209 antigen-like [Brachionichthys hirsutus]|uniref:CD209 antigen-like n=1 Tax=Brachionichthys hirsutus TaxID=412623 RepID=UPI0036049770
MDVMEIEDDIYLNKSLTMEGLITKDFQRKKPSSRCWTVSLGLLCSVLLAGNIGQIIYYERIIHGSSAEPTEGSSVPRFHRLQSDYEALTAERKRCEARQSNTTGENERLQQRTDFLTTERDRLKTGFDKMKNERDQMQASYNTSKQERAQLQASCSDARRTVKDLQSDYDNATASKERLQSKCNHLQREMHKQRRHFQELQRNHSSLKSGAARLEGSCNTLSNRINRLQSSYNSLRGDQEQLQTRYDGLQARYTGLVTDEDQLLKMIDTIRRSRLCQTGWIKFNAGCYFVSTEKKNWTLSRQDCVANGADLIVVNSRDEQAFINRLVNSSQNAWIGLTDMIDEGHWIWVDGNPVTTTYWQAGQPNSYGGKQDCGELVPASSGDGEWNDDGCFAPQIWICEK